MKLKDKLLKIENYIGSEIESDIAVSSFRNGVIRMKLITTINEKYQTNTVFQVIASDMELPSQFTDFTKAVEFYNLKVSQLC